MAALFLVFVAVVAIVVAASAARYMSAAAGLWVMAGLCLWFIYVGVMSYLGVVRNASMRPPGVAFVLVPVVVFLVVVTVRAHSFTDVALAFPLAAILGAQVFRVGVELFLHQLQKQGLVPRMLTYEGANVDIYIGATAPLIAWIASRGPLGMKLALIWNLLGLLALLNVVFRAVLTAPGPFNFIHAEVPDLMIGTFPFTFIPAFFVPLAVVLRVLGISSIRSRLRVTAD